MTAWDPEYRQYGVGNAAVHHSVLDAIAQGLDRYDFGAGTEEYKFYFSAYVHVPRGLVVPLQAGWKSQVLGWREAREG
jgi:CelD/BcsL family acetyltransferase involved in cellulose biosynthesis